MTLRGTEFPDLNTSIALPSEPSPLLTSLSETRIQFFDSGDVIVGDVESVTRFVTPEELLQELANDVTGEGPGSSLLDKITLAQAYLAAEDIESACGVLGAFINQVSAQLGKSLSAEQVEQFITDAQTIQVAIGCGL
jgi:hypothetical protein